MVKLPVEEINHDVYDYGLYQYERHDWGNHPSIYRDPQEGPITLLELESFARKVARFMQIDNNDRSNEDNKKYYQVAINRVRQMFNLEFLMMCHKCCTPHQQDPLTAPER